VVLLSANIGPAVNLTGGQMVLCDIPPTLPIDGVNFMLDAKKVEFFCHHAKKFAYFKFFQKRWIKLGNRH
jgi:hypothetical protein